MSTNIPHPPCVMPPLLRLALSQAAPYTLPNARLNRPGCALGRMKRRLYVGYPCVETPFFIVPSRGMHVWNSPVKANPSRSRSTLRHAPFCTSCAPIIKRSGNTLAGCYLRKRDGSRNSGACVRSSTRWWKKFSSPNKNAAPGCNPERGTVQKG